MNQLNQNPLIPGLDTSVRVQGLLNDIISAMNAGDGVAGRDLMMELIELLGGVRNVGLAPGNAMLYATFLALRHLYTVECLRTKD